ncbi:flap endonuclease-1 [Candidatus Pacearchaeota archaeon CG_4_9_14_3_um_filter_31_7]|nr:MAG: flap endonuclease-1 [Candidatus Pacearchaeota archaeon CG1_02_31_27]PIN92287.1 MAG: flap endonuclease-1 [Candidatus Pacearchaeota archaeon CG10_big_fil_rev_8_21_14_0_10_31_59]PIZ81233.1 MAG: flap endonuclease-1 [Candidatus Pacearchaeota archaeon CG_4_10_14_0_2_um_filter_31_10]PJA70954.1 MAG: flap endonuclease-1 [Candidatus Pacearchaeota archaeon CG_4_9_14_3_um_filter_31_7]
MGLKIADIIPKKEIQIKDLAGKKIAIDSFNAMYQFLSNIRQLDGTPLQDSKGNVTSHLSGFFYRTINLLNEGIKPIFVFDGKPPELKEKERESRFKKKEEAKQKYEIAKEKGDVYEMGKYAKQTIKITDEMVKEIKELLQYMGLPVIQATGEGEAQAAYIVLKGDAYATVSQDYDSLLFGSTRLIQNLTLSRKKKLPTGSYVPVSIELIEFENVLNNLDLDKEQLICLGILVGTDYNPGGIKGLGQKRALEFVKKYKRPVLIFEAVENLAQEKNLEIDFEWQEIFEEFNRPNIKKDYKIEFKDVDKEKVKKLLCKKHEFSENRIDSAFEKLEKQKEKLSQQDLKKFF